jgi:hypothetical protein
MALADAGPFHSVIPAAQTALHLRYPAMTRIAIFLPGVIFDEFVFRLILVSAIAWGLVTLAGMHDWCFWTAIIFVALVAYPAFHLDYLQTLTPSALTVLREVMLHGAGILWGYLYWRYGLVAAITGHISAHLSLEPLLSVLKCPKPV